MKLPKNIMVEILDLAEEDYTTLFDITAIIKNYFADLSENDQIEFAKNIIRHLLSRNYVEMYYDCMAKSHGTHRHGELLTSSEIKKEMADRSNWVGHEPREPDERWVTIAITDTGVEAMSDGQFLD